jgi:dipeptidyl aminopeptidase/acylaminoacyl peptidase
MVMDSRRVLLASVAVVTAVLGVAAAEKRPVTLEDIMSMRAVGSAEISPDGTAVLYTVRQWEPAKDQGPAAPAKNGENKGEEKENKGEEKKVPKMEARTHVYRVSTSGGEPRQLTFGERSETQPRWSPDGKFISFVSARGGSDNAEDGPKAQIWIMPTDGGEPWQLTNAKESISAYEWSPDSKMIAFTARETLSKEDEAIRKARDDERVFEGDFRLTQLWTIDVASKKDTQLTEGRTLTIGGAPTWSPDGKKLAFMASPTPMVRDDRRDIYVIGVEGGEPEKIIGTPASETSPQWSPDGKMIAYVADPAGPPIGDGVTLGTVGNSHLMLYDVAAKQSRDVSSPSFDLSPGEPIWTPNSQMILFSTGTGTSADVFSYTVATGAYAKLTSGGGLYSSLTLSKDGRTAAHIGQGPKNPPDVYVSEAPFQSARKLTTANPQVEDFALGETEVITWKSTDGLVVEGILLKPVNFDASKKYPLMVVVHGGPTGAHMNSFRVSYGDGGQFWAGQGWAVLYPNPRGSTNYGEKFMRGNIPDWGGGDYRDIMSGVDTVIKRGIADPDKLAVQGWSYGGYMTCWIVSQTDRFKAAMMGAGLSNLPSMYNTTDIPAYLGGFFNGIPSKTTKALYEARSGITYADRVTTPLLILHGANDERVPIGQPMEFYRALKDRGKTVELVFYPREGHGFSEYYHQLDRMKRQYEWITKYTLGEGKKSVTP